MYPYVGTPKHLQLRPPGPFATAPPRSFPLTVLGRAPIAAEGPLALTKFLADGIEHLQILLEKKVWKPWEIGGLMGFNGGLMAV